MHARHVIAIFGAAGAKLHRTIGRSAQRADVDAARVRSPPRQFIVVLLPVTSQP